MHVHTAGLWTTPIGLVRRTFTARTSKRVHTHTLTSLTRVCTVVDNLNIDFHCKLAHESPGYALFVNPYHSLVHTHPSVQSKIIKLHSTVVLHCVRRVPIMSRPLAPPESDPEATTKVLLAFLVCFILIRVFTGDVLP